MRFLIVVPKFWQHPFIHYDFPVGLAYLSAVLKQHGHAVDVLNCNRYYGDITLGNWKVLHMLLKRKLEEQDYDAVCTGGLSLYYDVVKQIVTFAKQIRPNIATIIGGGLVTSEPELIMEHIRPDVGVVGEGEDTIVEIAQELEGGRRWDRVNGVVYLDAHGKAILTPPRAPIDDLDRLPFPDYDAFNIQQYLEGLLPTDLHGYFHLDHPRPLPLLASRSCPFRCSWCFHPIGDKYRLRSLDSIFAEIEHLIARYDANVIILYDEMFGYRREWIEEFCRRFKRYNISLVVSMHATQIDEEVIRLLKEAGCIFLGCGLESASNKVLASMKKHSTIEQIEKALQLAYEADIYMCGNFIFGDRGETPETAQETIDWWLSHLHYGIHLSRIIPYPGSALWKYGIESGIITDKIKWIENQCGKLWNINLMQMTGKEQENLYRQIDYHEFMTRIPARVLHCKQLRVDWRKGPIYEMMIECPHCHATVLYKNLHTRFDPHPLGAMILGCRVCQQRCWVLPLRLEVFLSIIANDRKRPRIAILSANERSVCLLKFSTALREKACCVIDDLAHQGLEELEGIKVVPLSNNVDRIAEIADAIVVTSDQDLKEKREYLVALKRRGVFIYPIAERLESAPEMTDPSKMSAFISEACERANKALSSGDLDSAYATQLYLAGKYPTFMDTHSMLANIAMAKGDYETALDAVYTVNTLRPDDPAILHQMAILYCGKQKFQKGKEIWERTLQLDPAHREAFTALTMLNINLGEFQEAQKSIMTYTSLNADTSDLQGACEFLLRGIDSGMKAGTLVDNDKNTLSATRGLLLQHAPHAAISHREGA